MRFSAILATSLIVMPSMAFADEKLPVLKVGSETFSNVTVTEVTATDVYFNSDKGFANAKLADLDPTLQKHFHYDRAAAAKQNEETGSPQDSSHLFSSGQAAKIAEIRTKMNAAIFRVEEIVNQPVTSLARTPDMHVAMYSPGWFHPGAEKPDFNSVDIRATQELPYSQNDYVSSDLNPGVVFLGRELEFNPMTKYFYTDRSVPKKKLTEDEMVEVNQLYRVIGKCQQQLDQAQNPTPTLATVHLWARTHKSVVIAIAAALFVTLLFLRRRRLMESA